MTKRHLRSCTGHWTVTRWSQSIPKRAKGTAWRLFLYWRQPTSRATKPGLCNSCGVIRGLEFGHKTQPLTHFYWGGGGGAALQHMATQGAGSKLIFAPHAQNYANMVEEKADATGRDEERPYILTCAHVATWRFYVATFQAPQSPRSRKGKQWVGLGVGVPKHQKSGISVAELIHLDPPPNLHEWRNMKSGHQHQGKYIAFGSALKMRQLIVGRGILGGMQGGGGFRVFGGAHGSGYMGPAANT